MDVKCRDCDILLSAENINQAQALAKCPECDTVFSLPDQDRPHKRYSNNSLTGI